MAYNVNTNTIIDSSGKLAPVKFTSRANLPTGAARYLAFVNDQAELVMSTGTAPTTGPSANVTWYKFLTKPLDYKNEVYLEQGTVANGYVNSSIYNTIHKVHHNSDIVWTLASTTPFTSKYGGWHSTYLYAYYHQGNNENTSTKGAAKQDWATFTVSTITSRTTLTGTTMHSLQPGPKSENTFGVLHQGTSGEYITFSTDTWANGYNPPASANYGWGTFSETNGYSWNYGWSGTYKLTWSSNTWALSGAGTPSSGGTQNLGKALPTKWGKFYHGGDQGSQQTGICRYNVSADTWTTVSGQAANQVEQATMMGQDWGYWLGGYGPTGSWSGQNANSQKTNYANDTTHYSSISNPSNATSSGNACWGPIP